MSEKLYGLEGWERLETEIEDVIERVLEEYDPVPERVSIHVFRRMDVTRHVDSIASNALEITLENLDEEYGDPGGDPTEPTQTMSEAALAFARAVVQEYKVWTCEPTGEVIERSVKLE